MTNKRNNIENNSKLIKSNTIGKRKHMKRNMVQSSPKLKPKELKSQLKNPKRNEIIDDLILY